MTMRMLSVPLLLCAVMVLTTAAPGEPRAKSCVCLNSKIFCYTFLGLPYEMTWADAERTCLSLGGHLASIHSEAEYTFVKDLIRSKGSPMAWIGGYDVEGQNAAWFWSDGSPMNFTAWAQGEPNNYQGNQQNCMIMNFGGSNLWDDEECLDTFPSVCKIR